MDAKKIFGFCFAIACFFFFKWLFGSISHGETITPQFRSEFIRSSIDSCMKVQTAAEDNKDFTVGQLTNYCTCMANAEVNEFTKEDFQAIHSINPIPPAIQKRIDALAPACIADIVKAMPKQR
jgi:hypothetical protein